MQPDLPLLSLLPGSRPHEIERLLPVMAGVLAAFRAEFLTTSRVSCGPSYCGTAR